MMDLAREYGGETVRLSEIEALVAQTAKARYDILVTAVYWRINDHVAVGIPQKGVSPQPAAAPAPQAPVRRPVPPAVVPAVAPIPAVRPAAPAPDIGMATMPLRRPQSVATAPAPLLPASGPAAPVARSAPATPAARPAPRSEPIEADEVAAFKRALANAAGTTAPGAAAASRPGVAVRSGPILPPPAAATGFEDTVMPGADGSPDLSSTQYGELH